MIALLSAWKFLKAVPWQVYAGIAILIAFAILRSHWIGIGLERCENAHKLAEQKELGRAITQAIEAPAVAQEARDAIKPVIEERIKYVRQVIKDKPLSCPSYDGKLLETVREAESAANPVR